jgi:hypothetical protein
MRENREAVGKDSAAATDKLDLQLGKGVKSDAWADCQIDLAGRKTMLAWRMRPRRLKKDEEGLELPYRKIPYTYQHLIFYSNNL